MVVAWMISTTIWYLQKQKDGVISDHLDIPIADLEKCFKKENGKKKIHV